MPIFVLSDLTFDLVIQTRPSEGPNMRVNLAPTLWMWRNLFSHSWDISYTNKSQHQKQNLPQFTACGNKHNLTIFGTHRVVKNFDICSLYW